MKRSLGFCSEYRKLREVLLYCPDARIEQAGRPKDVLHAAPISYKMMKHEFRAIVQTYRRLGIRVHFISGPKDADGHRDSLFNLMYVRDLFFMTPAGAILASMAREVRRGEVHYAEEGLRRLGIKTRKIFKSGATFEGADALWVHEKLVSVGVGQRTNRAGFLCLKEELRKQGVAAVALPAPRLTQHLLGVLQIVDEDLALVRVSASRRILSFLKKHHIRVVEIPENNEVRHRQAMNLVVVAPRTVVMSSHCPQTRRIFECAGIGVAAELETSQLVRGAGGLACATGILWRQHDGN